MQNNRLCLANATESTIVCASEKSGRRVYIFHLSVNFRTSVGPFSYFKFVRLCFRAYFCEYGFCGGLRKFALSVREQPEQERGEHTRKKITTIGEKLHIFSIDVVFHN